MTADDRLDAVLAGLAADTEAPVRDFAFTARVAEAVARRRLAMRIAASTGWALVAAVVLAALAPTAAAAAPAAGVIGATVSALLAVVLLARGFVTTVVARG